MSRQDLATLVAPAVGPEQVGSVRHCGVRKGREVKGQRGG